MVTSAIFHSDTDGQSRGDCDAFYSTSPRQSRLVLICTATAGAAISLIVPMAQAN
jgi:hypothetical protein